MERIKLDEFLARVKMTRKDICPIIGVSHSTLSAYSAGRAFPDFQKCQKFLEAGMTVGELFGDEAEMKVAANMKKTMPTEIKKETLTPELCKEILKMALSG